jgi:hypothetical protein
MQVPRLPDSVTYQAPFYKFRSFFSWPRLLIKKPMFISQLVRIQTYLSATQAELIGVR